MVLVDTLKETANKGKKEKIIVKGDSRNKEIENHDRSEIREKVKIMYTNIDGLIETIRIKRLPQRERTGHSLSSGNKN